MTEKESSTTLVRSDWSHPKDVGPLVMVGKLVEHENYMCG